MKVVEKKKETVERAYIASHTCDLCGASLLAFQPGSRGHNTAETNVEMRLGDDYPDGGYGVATKFDVCIKCFETKLIPWFESQGAKPSKEEWDW